MQYLFGDSDIAARRLRALAGVFAESTRAFLLQAVTYKPSLAIDLGCGPGYTTHFLADVLPCERAIGLDNSQPFLSLAQQTSTERVAFLHHDITTVPFPVEPANLLYCRFLFTHLGEPATVLSNWATQLQPRGLLLIEETEQIETTNAVFATYLEIVETMLASQSNVLYIGPMLDSLPAPEKLERRRSCVAYLRVSNSWAAAMFHPNVQAWKHQPFIQANYSPQTIDKLEEDLYALSQDSSGKSEIEWGLRQIVFER